MTKMDCLSPNVDFLAAVGQFEQAADCFFFFLKACLSHLR